MDADLSLSKLVPRRCSPLNLRGSEPGVPSKLVRFEPFSRRGGGGGGAAGPERPAVSVRCAVVESSEVCRLAVLEFLLAVDPCRRGGGAGASLACVWGSEGCTGIASVEGRMIDCGLRDGGGGGTNLVELLDVTTSPCSATESWVMLDRFEALLARP